jgi:hypothetical protein
MQFTRIKGLSEIRRLPRLGKIRLGVRAQTKDGKEYPVDIPYFIVPPEVAKVAGEKPMQLEVMFPSNDTNVVFPQAYKYYGSGKGLKCIGNGERAMRLNEKTHSMEPVECPCPLLGNGCARRANLMVILPKVNLGGIYQIDTGSFNSMVDVNSGFDYLMASIGRIAFVPVLLRRQPRDTFFGGHRRKHYPLMIDIATTDIDWLNAVRAENTRIIARAATLALPDPTEENPAFDEGGTVVSEEELAEAGIPVENNGDGSPVAPVSQEKAPTAPVEQAEPRAVDRPDQPTGDPLSPPSPPPPPTTGESTPATSAKPARPSSLPTGQAGGPASQTAEKQATGRIEKYQPRQEAASGKKAPPGTMLFRTDAEQLMCLRFWDNPPGLPVGQEAIGYRCTVRYREQRSARGTAECWLVAITSAEAGTSVKSPVTGATVPSAAVPASDTDNGERSVVFRPKMTASQEAAIKKLAREAGVPDEHVAPTIAGMTAAEASRLIMAMQRGDIAVFQLAALQDAAHGEEETY